VWSATAGVITEKGTYKGPPVDVISVNKNSSGGGTIQALLGGKNYFVDGATLNLSDHAQAAHLRGTTTADSDVPGVSVTVDVTC
jgi:ABC-type nitrate/sulfonate/bicarbonate transport system substrate-binding protein